MVLLRFKEFYGLHHDLKIIRKIFNPMVAILYRKYVHLKKRDYWENKPIKSGNSSGHVVRNIRRKKGKTWEPFEDERLFEGIRG